MNNKQKTDFKGKIGRIINRNGYIWDDMEAVIGEIYDAGRSSALAEVVELIKSWKNEGDDPTEADLILEYILKSISSKRKELSANQQEQ